MHDREKTVISLHDAHEILSAFGIGPQSHGYQRWRRDDGFRQVDLEDVLIESSNVLSIDWRGWLQEAVDTIVAQLANIEIAIEAALDEDRDRGTINIDGKTADVKFVPDEGDDFDDVIASINQLIAPKARYRKFRSSDGTDGWIYGLQSNENWRSIQSGAGHSADLLFKDVAACE
jgi:hypothetical protein